MSLMKIEILGCYGNINGRYRATSFLMNDTILLDAGTVTEVLDDERLKEISTVLISHTHIDHIKGLFPFVDELVMMGGGYSIAVVAVKQVLDMIATHLFNNVVWPDFTAIPSKDSAVIRTSELTVEKESPLNGITVKPIQMSHTVFTTGFVVKEKGKGFMFTADTGPTERFWEVAREEKGIEFIIADVSFPNRLSSFARLSRHGTLAALTHSLDRHGLADMPVYISHIKPIFRQEILAELEGLNRKNIKELEQDAIITF
jgi:ribonuclease BN (tRNA processing enzyme)